MRVGLDIEQFVRDPYGSGIQRVLQYLALTWPSGDVEPHFVVPVLTFPLEQSFTYSVPLRRPRFSLSLS